MYVTCFYIFTFLSLLISSYMTYWDLKRRSPFFLFWIIIIFLVIIPSAADPFNRIIYPHSLASTIIIDDESLILYAFYTFSVLFSFFASYLVLHSFFKKKKVVYLRENFIANDKNSRIYLGFLITALFGFYQFYQQFGLSVLSSLDFTTRRESSSPLAGFLLSYPFMICAGLGCYFFIKKQFFKFSIVSSFYIFLYFVFGGSRQPLIAFILPFIAYYSIGGSKVNYKFIYLTIFISLFSKFIFDAMIFIRNLPSFNDRLEALSAPSELFISISSREGSEGNVRYAFYYFIQNASIENGYFGFNYLVRSFLFWLPSSIDFLGIKPKDFEYKMFFDYMNGREGTMHPTFFGSIYADSGWFFLPWVICISVAFYFLPIYIQRFKGVTYFCLWSTCLFYSFMLARGSIYGSIVVIAVGIVFAILINKIKITSVR